MINSVINESLSIYGSWNLEMPFVLTRSRLYNLEPIGTGTGHAESLTSYIARLAAAHSLTPAVLLGRTLTSVIDKRYWLQDGTHFGSRRSPLGNLFGEYGKAINGIGVIAKDWVTALQNLTLRSDLNFLTMIPWTDVFTHRNLLRPSRTWCPTCYQDWRSAGLQVYEPLLWTFRDLAVCTKHQRRLISQCQHCDHKIPWLGRCAQPGYCSKCGEWLGASVNEISNDTPILDRELERQIWVAKNLEELIIVARRMPSPAKARTAQSIASCINQTSEGIMNRFARLVGKRKNTVWGWQHGENQIPIDDLLSICNRVGISLVDFLYADVFVLNEIASTPMPVLVSGVKAIRRPARQLDRVATEKALRRILNEQTPLSMRATADRLKINKRLLYRQFPKLCKALSARHNQHLRACRDNRRYQYQTKLNETKDKLRVSGIYPSRRRVARIIQSQKLLQNGGGSSHLISVLDIAA